MSNRRPVHSTSMTVRAVEKRTAHSTTRNVQHSTHTARVRGAHYDAFMQLASGVQQELTAQQQRVDSVFQQLQSQFARVTSNVASSERAQESVSVQPKCSDATAQSRAAEPFTFHTDVPLVASLSASFAKIYADVHRVNELQQLSHDWTQQQQLVSPRQLQSPRQQHHATSAEESKQTPEAIAEFTKPLDSNASLSFSQHLVSSFDSTPLAHPHFDTSTRVDHAAALNAPVQATVLPTTAAVGNEVRIEFPALQRVAAKHAAATTHSADPFPALARALAIRQQRLGELANSAVGLQSQPASVHPSPLASSAAAAPSMHSIFVPASSASHSHAVDLSLRPPASAPDGVTLVDFDSDEPITAAAQTVQTLPPAEAEARDVKLLLKQQALQLIGEQVQARIKHLTRHRFFLTWRWQWRFAHAETQLSRKKLHRALSVWRQLSRSEQQRKNDAATNIQSWVRGRQAVARYPSLKLAVHFHRRLLFEHAWRRWQSRAARIARWHHRWSLKQAWNARQPHLSGSVFPAKRLRSEEGTMVMAEQYEAWRKKCVVMAKWIKYLAQGANR